MTITAAFVDSKSDLCLHLCRAISNIVDPGKSSANCITRPFSAIVGKMMGHNFGNGLWLAIHIISPIAIITGCWLFPPHVSVCLCWHNARISSLNTLPSVFLYHSMSHITSLIWRPTYGWNFSVRVYPLLLGGYQDSCITHDGMMALQYEIALLSWYWYNISKKYYKGLMRCTVTRNDISQILVLTICSFIHIIAHLSYQYRY